MEKYATRQILWKKNLSKKSTALLLLGYVIVVWQFELKSDQE